ncbi:MAG: LicD family protein [Clostridia bacterium]|nr:LicD family protein [Clostridia bacterium]
MDAEIKSFECSMSELQEIGTNMLRTVAGILEDESIPYCMFFGSLLGTVRHRGPIPWDYDIDIAVPENEYARFIDTLNQKLPDDYWVDFRSGLSSPKIFARIGISGYDTHTSHIDVYRLVGFPENTKRYKAYRKKGRLLLEMRLVKEADLRMYSGEKKAKIQKLRKLLKPIKTQSICKRFDKLCDKYPYEKAKNVGVNVTKRQYVYPREMFDNTVLADYADFKVRIPEQYDSVLRTMYGDYMKFPPQAKIDAAMNARQTVNTLESMRKARMSSKESE